MVDIIRWRKGMVISEPGIYSGVPMSVYHSQTLCDGPSISSSGLRRIFNESPAHFYCTWDGNPDRETAGDSAAFTLGRAAHHLLLGEDDFSTLFIQRPEELDGKPWQGNRTVCREWSAAQEAAGRTVLKPDDIKAIRGMARSLAAHPLIGGMEGGILRGAVEQTIVFKDKETGVFIKVRPDVIPNSSGDVADLKTTSEIGFGLDRSIGKYRYDMQAALVGWAMKEVLGIEMMAFSFVFAEKTAPWSVEILTLHEEDIERGHLDNRAALDAFAHCLNTGNWFGPGGTQDDARWAYIPEMVKKDSDYRREMIRREIGG